MASEKPSPTEKPSPPKAQVVTEGAPKAIRVPSDKELKEAPKAILVGKKDVEKGGNIPTQGGEKPVKTDIDLKKEAIGINKIELQKKIKIAQEVADGKKVYNDELNFLENMDGPGLVPPRLDQQMVKSRDFEESQKALRIQENKTAEAIKGKMDAELKSVTDSGKIDQLDPDTQTKVRTEIVRTAIDPQKIPNDTKKAILKTMKGADGKPLDIEKVNLEELTQSQKDFILNSQGMQGLSLNAVKEYKELKTEALKNGKQKIDTKVLEELQIKYGLPNVESLELSQLSKNMEGTEYPSNTQIGIIQRVLAENTFSDLQDTLGKDALKWNHLPDSVKREIVFDSFSYDPAKNSTSVEQSIHEAKKTVSQFQEALTGKKPGETDVEFQKRKSELSVKKPGETDEQFDIRIKDTTGVQGTHLDALSRNGGVSLEARKAGLSPAMRMLADFFGPIGAALGMPFWQEYMGQNTWGDDFDENGSQRWESDIDPATGKARISKGVLKSNKSYLDNGQGLKLEGGSYEKQASSASEAIKANEARYRRVAEKTGVPWELIGAIHFRESSLNFNTCLHNGDPLGQKTVRVPAGRGPFDTWEAAAIDALNMKGGLGFPGNEITQTNQLEQVAGYAEKYNGFGYRNKGVSSAYVWAGTEAYTGGMYVADHVFSRTKKDPRPGVMAIISKLVPTSVIAEKRTPDVSALASSVGAFKEEFSSVGAKENPKTGTTLCSQTAREDLYQVLGRTEDIPSGNANVVHDIYRNGSRFEGMVGSYFPSFSPPENANVADVSLTSKSQYGHRVTAYKGSNGWMVLDPYNPRRGDPNPQLWDSYVKKNDVRGVAFYQKEISKEENSH